MPTMPTSVMPKGVEHQEAIADAQDAQRMPTSVMPKGVEHRHVIRTRRRQQRMPTSVMPKGVEHISPLPSLLSPARCPPL